MEGFLSFFIYVVPFLIFVLSFVTFAILAERKVMGTMQLRSGPNRTGGRFGLLQTVADVFKLLLKEDTIPKDADRTLFKWSPILAFVPAFMVLAVIPFTKHFQFADIGIGLLYYVAISSLSVIGIVTGGWASNNKYSLIGGMRAAAQMISYEIPLVLSIVGVIFLAGSLNLNTIVGAQQSVWFILYQPVGFIIFYIASVAELNRVPFDLPEAESELVAGYLVEYSGFRFAIFMLAEYVYMFAMAAMTTVLFLGGWHPIPYFEMIPGAIWFAIKFSLIFFSLMWIRFTFPRIRGDQLMTFAWKGLIPISIINIFLTAIIYEILS
nr:NADH-quinone oxidoreductase subunit NuoH [Fervidibacillus halotolerans]